MVKEHSIAEEKPAPETEGEPEDPAKLDREDEEHPNSESKVKK